MGQRDVSTRALSWIAIYRELYSADTDNAAANNFRGRTCHDFAATFLKGDPEFNRELSAAFSYLPPLDMPTSGALSRHTHAKLNHALCLGILDYNNYEFGLWRLRQLIPRHSVIAATRPRDRGDQLVASKFGISTTYLSTLAVAAAAYGCTHFANVTAEDYQLR